MDQIRIDNLDIFAYHGVFAEEKKNGQHFLISAVLDLSVRQAAFTDDLSNTVNYAEVCEVIKETVLSEKCDLIEAVAENIAGAILQKFGKVQNVSVTVAKPEAPIPMDFENVSVTVNRGRHVAYLSIGSNVGDREYYLDYAVDQLNHDDYTRVQKISSYINTEPYGFVDQPDFLNAALMVETLYTAPELLYVIHDIEKDAKRERVIHWGPRTLDIDILLFDDEIIYTEDLCIPHPEMPKRTFVLQPMAEIAPFVLHPLLKKTIKEMYEELSEVENRYTPYVPDEFTFVDALKADEEHKVVFAGVRGAYAEMAMYKFFGNDVPSYHVESFDDVVHEVVRKRAKYGVIPIENSSAGFVSGSYDIIRKSGVKIVGEVILDIEHALLGLPEAELSDIKKVYSHAQGLMQCKDYIDAHGFEQEGMSNTAVAAQKVQQDGDITQAAIASERAAELYGLKILERRINFSHDNSTKFAIVTKHSVAVSTSDNINVCFSLPHKSGSLYHILSLIKSYGLNMTSIESRPSLKKKWEYFFYITFEGKLTDKTVQHAIGALQCETDDFTILGTY